MLRDLHGAVGIGDHLNELTVRVTWSTALFASGQGILAILGDRTRAGGKFTTSDGVALLAPDSETYLEMSESVATILATPWTRWAYPSLLLAVDSLGLSLGVVVLLQSLALIAAGTMLYSLAERATGVALAGIAASAILLVNPLTAQWTRFILTESFFFALVVTVVWASTRLAKATSWSPRAASIAVVAGAIASMLRPNGVLVLGGAAAAVALSAARTRRSRVGWMSVVWFGTAILLGVAADVTGQPGEGNFASQLYDGVVIEGTDEVRTTLAMPSARDNAGDSTFAALQFVAEHPGATARLAVTRIAVEVAQVRPHYPTSINLAIGTAMSLLLVGLLLGATDERGRELMRVGLLVAAPLLLLVGLTFAVPEGRYGWGAIIAVAPLAGIGVARANFSLRRTKSRIMSHE